MIILQRRRRSEILEQDALLAAQCSAMYAHERLQAALADDAEVWRVADELRELRSHERFKSIIMHALEDDAR